MDASFAISTASALLALILAIQAYHAFSYTKKDYLLNFSGGFLLLGLSYVILIPLALGLRLPGNFGDADDIVNYPVFAVMQTIGYVLIALAYSQTIRARKFLTSLIGVLILLVVVVLLPGVVVPDFVDILLYAINTSLLGYVLYHMLKVMPPTNLVFVAFLLLALHEYTSLVASVNEFIYGYPDEGSFFVAQVLRLSAFCILFTSFLFTRRRAIATEMLGSAESA